MLLQINKFLFLFLQSTRGIYTGRGEDIQRRKIVGVNSLFCSPPELIAEVPDRPKLTLHGPLHLFFFKKKSNKKEFFKKMN